MADEKNVVEEVAETVIVDEKEHGVLSDIWNGIKKNWVQGLIGLGTAVASFAGGYFLANRDHADSAEPEPNPEEVPPFVEGGDLI